MKCSVENCNKPVSQQNLCSMHASRLWRLSSLDLPNPPLRVVFTEGKQQEFYNKFPNSEHIILTKGQYAIIDKEDFAYLSRKKWWAVKQSGNRKKKHFYVQGNHRGKNVLLHRFLLNATGAQKVDHINGNGLDNRKCNLRICNSTQNSQNSTKKSNNKSGYKGVYKGKYSYIAQLILNKRKIYLGSFQCPIHAAYVYDIWSIFYFGEFALTNKKMGLYV